MIIQYTILFSLHSLTIEAAISSTSGIRGSAAAAVDDSVAAAADDEHRASELHNSSNNDDDSHRFLQVATDVSDYDMRAYLSYHMRSILLIQTSILIATLSLSTPHTHSLLS
jgi:hypothetical protein